jgi:hypothetical protein
MAGRIGVVPGAIQVGNRRQGFAAPGSAVPGIGSQQGMLGDVGVFSLSSAVGFAAALHPANVANQGELLSHGKITHGYVMHRLTDENAGTLIRMGQQLFVRKDKDTFTEAGAQSADNQPHHINNLWMYNTQARSATRLAMAAFREVKGTDPNNQLLKDLYEPEERQAYHYKDGVFSKIFDHKLGQHFSVCSKVGQSTRWNMLGVSLAHSAADTQVHNEYTVFPINVGFRGVFKQENVWGPEAAPGSQCFYIHKRIQVKKHTHTVIHSCVEQDPFTKNFDFIGMQPYCTIDDFPPMSARRYTDFGGNLAVGDVYAAVCLSVCLRVLTRTGTMLAWSLIRWVSRWRASRCSSCRGCTHTAAQWRSIRWARALP